MAANRIGVGGMMVRSRADQSRQYIIAEPQRQAAQVHWRAEGSGVVFMAA